MNEGSPIQHDRRARGIALLLEQTARLVYDEKQPRALHAVQWSALRYFERAGEQARNAAGLARYLGVTSAPASRTVSSLVSRGLAEISESPHDSRIKTVSLTDRGRAMLENDPLNRCALIVQELDQDELTTLAMALDKVHARLSRSED